MDGFRLVGGDLLQKLLRILKNDKKTHQIEAADAKKNENALMQNVAVKKKKLGDY